MRKRSEIVLRAATILCLLALLCQPTLAAFTDVSGWYAEDVSYAEEHGLVHGTSATTFSPNSTMTRGMLVTVLYRMALSPETDTSSMAFADVDLGQYYAEPVAWAAAAGIVQGTSSTTFSPSDRVTREQICTLLLRYCQYIGYELPQTVDAADFTDQEIIHEYALEAVSACQRAGLVNGYQDGSFQPQATATRAEVCAMLHRLGLLLETDGYTVGPGKGEGDLEPEPEPEPEPEEEEKTEDEDAWKLILVNRWNPFPEGYTDNIELAYMGYQNGQDRYVDARIYDDLQAMFAAMRADGVYPVINGAYRSHAHQTSLYQDRIALYQSYGYSYTKAVELTQKEVAIPGTSEHELGLALDIISNYDTSAVYNWLAKYSWKYGFIHRYPSDKTAITGISNEPWHYRYVGKEAAKEIYESGLTLEEYVAQK